MAYTFEQIFAADPANPANVAANAAVTIFAPGDASMTPLAITDPDGTPLPNPIPVNANGFGSAFAHATLDRVAWAGGGFTGFFTSYEGMKQVAVDAQAAAESAATEAAAAGANAAAEASAALAGAVADAEAAQASAASAAALVGAPADTAIAAAVTGSGTATKAALNATYAPASGSANYASQKVFDNTTTAADITAWLAAPSPLGVKRSIGNATITDAVVLPSNLNWDATGTTLTLNAASAKSMLTNDWTNGNSNIRINGLTLNANRTTDTDPRPPASWHTIYLQKVTGLSLDNVTVLWPLAFGGLIVNSTDIYLTNYRTHSEHINQDGIHFFDCSDVTIDGIHGVAGDDLLGISAQYGDVRNFTVANVIGTSKHASLVRVNQTDRSVAAAETRTIENMAFTGLVGYDCANKGFTINDVHSSSIVRNIRVTDSTFVRTARSGVDIVRAQDSEFDVTLIDCGTGIGITDFLTLHPFYAVTLIRSRVHARVINVKDGYNGIHIAGGNSLIINPEIQYPTAGLTNAQNCVFTGGITDSLIADGYTDGGGRGIQLGSSTLSTVRTRVRGMLIRNNTGFSIAEGSLSDSNLIEANLIRNGGVSKVGASTKVRRNDGVYVTENQGVATIASGGTSITVNHGLNVTPVVVMLTGRGPETADAYVNTLSSSQFQIMVPAAVTANRDVMWEARA